MTNNIRDIVVYLFRNYPNPKELSKPRLVKMIYLADWKSSIDHGQQLTDIKWFYNHYGPYVDEIIKIIKDDTTTFTVVSYQNFIGGTSDTIALNRGVDYYKPLHDNTKKILDIVIKATSKLNWNEFIGFVYSTYPVVTQPKYSKLDLVSLAKEYKELTIQE